MTADLRAALADCQARHGCIGGVVKGDQRVLILRRHSVAYRRITLSWPEYFAAYCYWQELSRPGIGRMGHRHRKGKCVLIGCCITS